MNNVMGITNNWGAEVKTEVMNLGPDMAKALLSANKNNRKLRGRYVSQLAGAMRRGEWELNGQAITVSDTGILLDGQHRLSAVIESGKSVPMLVVYNVKDKAFDTIDRGLRRSVGDILAMNGEKNTNSLAAALQLLYRYDKDFSSNVRARTDQATAKQAEQLLENHGGIRYWVNRCSDSKWMKTRVSSSAAAFCFYVFSDNNEDAALDFFDALESGLMLTKDSAAYHARQRLDDIAANPNYKPERLFKLALMFKCFKAFRDRKPMKKLRVRVDEPGIFDL